MQFISLRKCLIAAGGGLVLMAAPAPLYAQDEDRDTPAGRAAELRAEIPGLPHLMRTVPNVYLIRVKNIETGAASEAQSEVIAAVERTLKGKRRKEITLSVRQRQAGAGLSGLTGGGTGGGAGTVQESLDFFSPERFLSPRNPVFGGPFFEKDRLYLVFTDIKGERLLGGPYGYQPVTSPEAFWVQTVKRLIANPDSRHAVDMSYRDFAIRHRSVFLMVIGDCLGTEVALSEPIWGEPVSRDDIDPARILPESASACVGAAMDKERAYLGLIEAEPWLYQVKHGYPNQRYVEIRDGMLDFSELGYDIGFPGGGRISVEDFAARLSKGQ